jgi:hypothetical protein
MILDTALGVRDPAAGKMIEPTNLVAAYASLPVALCAT